MAGPTSSPYITLDACARMVEASSNASKAQTADMTSAASPNWDAIANSFASLSVALAYISILLAIVAIISAIGWGYVVTVRAEKEARKVARECAKECANELINRWLAEEASAMIRTNVDNLQNASLGQDSDYIAADEIGKAAG